MPDFPTQRGRRTQAAIDAAARTVVVRNGILATTVADITAEAGRSAASFYNYYDSKEAMVRQWALRFRDDANQRALSVIRHGLSDRERAYEAAAAHWYTYRNRLAEAISVSQLAMVSDDFAQYWSEICQIPISFITETVKRAQAHGYCVGDDPQLMAEAIVAMFNQFCYLQLSGKRSRRGQPDDQACIQTLANIYYRAIYSKEDSSKLTGRAATPGVIREFVGLPSRTAGRAAAGGHPCQGLYHHSVGRKPKVALIAAHYQIDFSEHYLAEYMAIRGIGFLGWNTRFRGFESSFLLDHALVDIGVGVRWLREVQGVETVVLLGNSGGGSLMAAYQSQAVDPNVTPLDGMRPAAGVTELPAADAYVAAAAHPGRPDVLTAWMDAAVIDENDPVATDPELDLFDERNGPPYSPEFISRYRSAQVKRNHTITDWAESELKRVRAAGFSDRPFSVMRTWADPRMVDPSIEPTKRRPNQCYAGTPVKANRSAHGIAAACTLRGWLGMWSLRVAQTRAAPHLARITCPALVLNAEADTGIFPSDAQQIYDGLASSDKTQVSIDTDHYFTTPGARSEQADTIAKWIAKRWR